MPTEDMLTTIDARMLAAAFPARYYPAAIMAGSKVGRLLASRQWTERFVVLSEHEPVSIPTRLHFQSHDLAIARSNEAWRFARALQTRSTDGFERQCALRDLLVDPPAWASPFILALIGEYIVEILQDISSAMSAELERALATFLMDNPAF